MVVQVCGGSSRKSQEIDWGGGMGWGRVTPWRRKGRKQNPQRDPQSPCGSGGVWASPVPARAVCAGQKSPGPDTAPRSGLG